MSEKFFLDPITAEWLLPHGDHIHTFMAAGFLIGADWSREEVINEFNKPETIIEIAGNTARAMKHGIVMYPRANLSKAVFIEADKEKLDWLCPESTESGNEMHITEQEKTHGNAKKDGHKKFIPQH